MLRNKFIQYTITVICGGCLLAGCAHYRLVEMGKRPSDAEKNGLTGVYAIAKNNVIVPEFVIDREGVYPSSPDEAWRRFNERRDDIEAQVDRKYNIPPTIPYQTERIVVMVGLCAVSPVVIPTMYISDKFHRHEGAEEANERVSFRQTVKNYFSLASADPAFEQPQIRDEFEVIDILRYGD